MFAVNDALIDRLIVPVEMVDARTGQGGGVFTFIHEFDAIAISSAFFVLRDPAVGKRAAATFYPIHILNQADRICYFGTI